ncbi:hypothetical protein ABEB36_006802 [Hypothenemus hampei]|uniref:C2H2-type domain-containing protein n=1 Tax=Hypothenemus hampei TaxID=57062 RepID=A0ABD1ESK4_HYPHA
MFGSNTADDFCPDLTIKEEPRDDLDSSMPNITIKEEPVVFEEPIYQNQNENFGLHHSDGSLEVTGTATRLEHFMTESEDPPTLSPAFAVAHCPRCRKRISIKYLKTHIETCKSEILTTSTPKHYKNGLSNSLLLKHNNLTQYQECRKQLSLCQKILEIGNRSCPPELHTVNNDETEIENNEILPPVLENMESQDLLRDCTLYCSFCSYTTSKHKTLMEHERHHKRCNPKVLQCAYCTQRYTRNALSLHMDTAHPGQKFDFKQKPTNFDTSSKGEYRKHERYECTKCLYKNKNISKLRKHENTHNRWPTEQCPTCDFYSTGFVLKVHVCPNKEPNTKLKSDRNNQIYKCSWCTFTSTNKSKCRSHESLHHSKEQLQLCPNDCGYENVPSALEAHLTLCNNRTETYKCPHCSWTAKNKPLLKQHMISHRSSHPVLSVETEEIEEGVNKENIQKKRLNLSKKSDNNNSNKNPPVLENMIKKSAPEKLFYCSQCPFNSKVYSTIMAHKKDHNEDNFPVIKCKYCDEKYPKNLMKQHVHNEHPKCNDWIDQQDTKTSQTYNCSKCSFFSKKKAGLIRHLRSHKEGEVLHKCPWILCNYQSTMLVVGRHKKICIHRNDPELMCSICNKSYSDKLSLSKHEERVHHKELPRRRNLLNPSTLTLRNVRKTDFTCSECTFSTDLRFKLNCHIKNTHVAQEVPLKSKKVTNMPSLVDESEFIENDNTNTDECANGYGLVSTKAHITKHMKQCSFVIKKKKPNFKCSKCRRSFDLRIKLNKHINNEHTLQCPHCDYKNIDKYMVENHASLHRNKKQFYCPMCSFKSEQEYTLKFHMIYHRKRLAMKCPYCNFKGFKHAFFKHILDHAGEEKQDFKCEFCIFNCETKESYYKHIQDHCKISKETNHCEHNIRDETSEKDSETTLEFQCSHCTYSSHLRVKLNNHKRKRHSESKAPETVVNKKRRMELACEICSYTTSYASNLYTHVNRHKNKNEPIMQCPICNTKGTTNSLAHATHNRLCQKPNIHRIKEIKEYEKVHLKCPSCSFRTYKPNEYYEHGKTCSLPNRYPCQSCSFTTSCKYLLERHSRSHDVLNLPINQCPKCAFRSSGLALSAHINACKGQS